MSGTYKLKEVRVHLQSGVVLTVEVDSMAGLKTLLQDLAAADFTVHAVEDSERNRKPGPVGSPPPGDDPASRVEIKASLAPGTLSKARVLAFKDNAPQLLRPGAFGNVTDALLALLFSVEAGLQVSKISYESFKGLYESQNIKSGTPMRILLSNLRASNYLDKAAHSADKSLSLTAKGETKAIEMLQEQCK